MSRFSTTRRAGALLLATCGLVLAVSASGEGHSPLLLPLLGGSLGMLPLTLLVGVRVCGAILFRHDWRSVALHPIGSLMVVCLALDSFVAAARRNVIWKGRVLPAAALEGRRARMQALPRTGRASRDSSLRDTRRVTQFEIPSR